MKVQRVKRRNVLKSLGLGLSAGLILPELLVSCKKPDPGPEIVYAGTVAVIGAGPAGLYAADILRSKGIKVVIYEAGDDVGGRVKSYRPVSNSQVPTDSFLFVKPTPDTSEASIADFPLELGPQTIIGSNSTFGKIMKDLTISTHDMTEAVDQYILSEVAKTGTGWAGDTDYAAVQSFLSVLPNYTGSGVSIKDVAGLTDRGAALLNALAGNYYGSSIDRIDAGLLASDLKLAMAAKDSFTQLPIDTKQLNLIGVLMQDALYTRFVNVAQNAKFNTPVTAIDYGSSEKITIADAKGGSTEYEKVIVTVPLPILQNGDIAFSPPLPSSMTSSLGMFAMDSCIRVILDFKVNFWGDSNTGFIWGDTTSPQYFNAAFGRSQAFRTLTLTICGPKAEELSPMGADMIPVILAEMDKIYDNNATKYIRRSLDDQNLILYTIQDWSKEKYIKGGFSHPVLGAKQADRVAIGAPVANKIFFAGEATDVSGFAGTVNGAFASAERVAQEVIDSILV